MRVCFAVERNEGMESQVFGHFGSAPIFMIVDTQSGEAAAVNNGDLHHAHGMCNPIAAIGGHNVDAVVVGGIGAGAISKLNSMGIQVYQAAAPTIRDNVALIQGNRLFPLSLQHACRHHEGGGCGQS